MVFPDAFVQRMQPILQNEWNAFVAAYDHPLRRGLRVNTAKIDVAAFRRLFPLPLEISPFADNCFYLDAPHKAGTDPLHHAGAYYMQEPSASSAVSVLAPTPGERVLDLCAAPGGKSTQIAAALKDTGLLWSNEYVPARAKILAQNIERWGTRQVVVSNTDSQTLCEALPGFFDAVLVDAPCSGEGMFRKEPQALTEWSVDNIHRCADRQLDILRSAATAVRPGGRLVYSTCTFAPEENESVVAAFLTENPAFTLEPIDVPWGCPGWSFERVADFCTVSHCKDDLTGCRRIFPHHGGEGHFIAKFRRADKDYTPRIQPYPIPNKDANRQAAIELYNDCFTDTPTGHFVTIKNQVWLLPEQLPDYGNLHIIAAGVPVATVCKNRLEPSHSIFLAGAAHTCRRQVRFQPTDALLHAYLHGEEIPCNGEPGWTAVCVADIPLGFGKVSGGRLKNRYPKGLRLL